MRIGVTTLGCDGGRSGIGRYAICLLREFARLDLGLEWEVVVLAQEEEAFLAQAPGLTPLRLGPGWAHPLAQVAWHQGHLPALCRRRGWDALFLPAANRRLPWRVPCPSLGTVHDLSSLHVSQKYDRARMFYITQVLPRLMRRLTRVLTVSQSSRQDIEHFGGVDPDRIEVTPLAADLERYHPRGREESRQRLARVLGWDQPYILYISRLEHPGKNHVRLIEAFQRFKTDSGLPHRLLLAGPDKERAQEVHRAAEASPWRQDVVFTGFLEEDLLPHLYRAADLLAFPSLYEGFGLPLLEAMACGTPVAAADISSLPEVAGGAGLLFDPHDVAAMAQALARPLLDRQLWRRLARDGLARAAGFTWRRTARLTLSALARTLETRSGR